MRRDPARPVRARIDDLTVELRAVPEPGERQSAADAFREVGPWEGETLDELLAMFTQERRDRGSRRVAGL
jgi:hypothetical protein